MNIEVSKLDRVRYVAKEVVKQYLERPIFYCFGISLFGIVALLLIGVRPPTELYAIMALAGIITYNKDILKKFKRTSSHKKK